MRRKKHLAGANRFSPSPRLPVSPSPRLPVSPSPRLPFSPSPLLPLSFSWFRPTALLVRGAGRVHDELGVVAIVEGGCAVNRRLAFLQSLYD